MIDVSIILVNYKTSNLCHNLIESIYEKTKDLRYEIIIVDNSEDQHEFSLLSDLEDKAKIIKSEKNIGFGMANNLGAQHACGKNLFFLNTDTLLINNAIKELNDYLNTHPNVSIVGANLFSKELKPNISYELKEKNVFHERCFLGLLSKRIKNNYFFNHKRKPISIKGYVSGACLMIKKDIFEKINGFDKSIFMYAEDSLICYQAINELKTKIFNIPSAKIIHLEGGSFKEINEKRVKMQIDGNVQYYLKTFGYKKTIGYLRKSISYFKYKILFAKMSKKNKLVEGYRIQQELYKIKYAELEK